MYTIPFFILVIGTSVVKLNAYKFDNPDFNQLLANDFEELYSNSHLVNIRNRRDASDETEARCPKRGPHLCCEDKSLRKLGDSKMEYKIECYKEVTGMDKPDKAPHDKAFDPFDCEKMKQRKSNMLIDADGKIKPEEFEKYIKDSLAEFKYLDPVVDKIVAGCIADINNVTITDGKCQPDGLVADFCIFKNIQLNCPEDQIKNKESCAKLQKRLSTERGRFPGAPSLVVSPPGSFEPPPPPPALSS